MKTSKLNALIERIKKKSIDSKYELHVMTLTDRLNHYSILNESINYSNFSEDQKICSRKNYLINLVSYFETWMRIIFEKTLEVYDKNKKDVASKIKAKLKVEDLLTMQEENVTISQVIIESINFQNLDEIQAYFSTLLDINFFKDILITEMTGMKPMDKNFYPILEKGLSYRHEIVHNFINDINFSNGYMERLSDNIIKFVMSAMGLCNNKIKQFVGYNPDMATTYIRIIGEIGEDNLDKHFSFREKDLVNMNLSEHIDDNLKDFMENKSSLIDFLNLQINQCDTDIVSRLYLSSIKLLLGEPEQCEELIKETILIEPRFPFLWLYYAEYYVFHKNIDEALKCIQRALTFYNKNASFWLILIYLLYIKNQKVNEKFLNNAFKYLKKKDLFFIIRDLVVYTKQYEELEFFKDVVYKNLPDHLKKDYTHQIKLLNTRWDEYYRDNLHWRFFRFF